MRIPKSKILAIVFWALVTSSVCSISTIAMAKQSPTEESSDIKMQNITAEGYEETMLGGEKYVYIKGWNEKQKIIEDVPATSLSPQEEAIIFGENFGKDRDHLCVENPSYLINNDAMLPYGPSQPSTLWDISSKGGYYFDGEFRGQNSVYTEYLFTGKYSYTITVSCNASGTGVTCNAYNYTSYNNLIDGVTVPPGQSKTFTITGLSNTSKVYLKFTGLGTEYKVNKVSGTIS